MRIVKMDFDKAASYWDTPQRVRFLNDIVTALKKEVALTPDMFYKATAPGGYICIADLDLDDGEFLLG